MLCRVFESQTCQDIGGGVLQCVAPTIVNVGQDCDLIGQRKCADGLMCGDHDNMGTTPDQCFAPLQLNAACDQANSLCDIFLNCDTNNTCQYENDYTGTCPTPPAP